MKTNQKRKELHDYVDQMDQISLDYFFELIEEYKNKGASSKAVNQKPSFEDTPLKPFSMDEYFARITRSEENFKEGKFISEEEMSTFIKELHD
jgi:hypothetical protein